MPPSTALLTDHYELTMLDAALRSGAAELACVFEVFARRLPPGRRFGVVAGTGRLLDELGSFRFGSAELEWLADAGWASPATLDWLQSYRFTGDVSGFREGEAYFANEPVLTVEASFAEAVLLETLVLSTLNHDAAIAAAAARMVAAAEGRALVDMGSRRTHEAAAVAAARAAYLAGFTATSNLEAGRRYGVPTVGTSAHAFTLAHASERVAFEAQVAALGTETTLLVDTYDVEEGVRTAVEVCRAAGVPGPGAVRIDSGNLPAECRRIRSLLDELGAGETAIAVTGDLDEYAIQGLRDAPADSYGVGTRLVTGSGAPTAEMIYKLVAIADRPGPGAPCRPVAKRSAAKATVGGRKTVRRIHGADGRAVRDVVTIGGAADGRPLQVPLVIGGEILAQPALAEVRSYHQQAIAALPEGASSVEPGEAALAVEAR